MAASNKIQVGYIEAQDGAQFQVDAGTAAAPGLCFDDSAATGLYSPGTGQIAWSTSGKQTALRILADGKVGVDCSPTVALEVNGTIKATAIDAPIEGTLDDWILHAGDTNTKFGFPGADQFEIHAGGGPKLRIDSTGKLGINHSSPSTIIHAVGNSTVGTSVTMTLQSHDTANATAGVDLLARNSSNVNKTSKILATSGSTANVDLTFYTHNTEKLRITSGGKTLIHGGGATGANDTATILENGNTLNIHGTSSSDGISVVRYSANYGAYGINIGKSRNSTFGTNTLVQDGNELGHISFYGADGTDFEMAAQITGLVDGDPATGGDGTDMPGALSFRTTPEGSDSPTEKLRIKSDGTVIAGATSVSGGNRSQYSILAAVSNNTSATGHGLFTIQAGSNTSSGNEVAQLCFSDPQGDYAWIQTFADNTTGATDKPGRLVFSTTPDNAAVPTERLRIDSSGRVIITNDAVTNPTGTNTQYAPLVVRGNTSATSSRSGWLNLARSEASANISANEGIGEIWFGDQQAGEYGAIKCFADADAAVGDYPGRLSFWTTADGGTTMSERLRIDSSGNLTAVNTTSGATTGVTLKIGASAASGTNSGTLILNNGGLGNSSIQFDYENSAARCKIYMYRSTNDIIFDTSGTEKLRITSDGHLRVQGTYNGSSTTANDFPCLNINNLQGTYTANNILGGVTFGKAPGHTNGVRAGMLAIYQGNGSEAGNVGAHLSFRTSANGAGDSSEKLFISDTGVLCTGNYRVILDSTMGSMQINGGSSGGRLSFRGTTTSQYGGLGEIHGFWDTNKVASILFHAGVDTGNKDDGEIRMYTRPSGGNSAQRFRIDSTGVCLFGSTDTYASNSVSIHPGDGMVNFGMDGRASLMTGQNSCYIFSGSGASGAMPAGSLVLQSRANVNRNIFFATGDTPSLKWQIHGSTGTLQEFPYNTSTSSQSTSTGNGYHLRRVRNGQVPTGTSGNTYTLINTSTIADAGAYIIVLRSFEQNVTGGVLWSIRVVSSVFYLHHGSGNDGETVEIPVTYSGHANNATTQSSNGHGPVTLKIHFYNGSAHTAGKITITFNGFSYSGSNCDYYLYKLIDI